MLSAPYFFISQATTRMGAFFIPPLSYLRNCVKSALNFCSLLLRSGKIFISGSVIVFSGTYTQVTIDAAGGTTGGTVINYPIHEFTIT